MRMKALRLSGFMVMVVTLALMAYRLRASEQANSDVDEILELHRALLESHIRYDVDGVLAAEAEQLVVVSRGEVEFPTKAERFHRFERYLKSVEFEEYRDLISPIVRVSDDGTLGWLIAQVKIAGTQTSGVGEQTPIDAIWAWIELYEKHEGNWIRIGEVSSFKPPNH